MQATICVFSVFSASVVQLLFPGLSGGANDGADGVQRNPGIGRGDDCFPRNALRFFRATYFAFIWRKGRISGQQRLR
jgi:hypothetical protein